MFKLPTKSDRRYRGFHPSRLHSLGYSNSLSQQAIAAHLSISYPVHLETNDGQRFIASRNEINMNLAHPGAELYGILKGPVTAFELMGQESYDRMLILIREVRGSYKLVE